ncbi:MAG: hypothetical protein KF804_05865 [Burkholderiales bacterium]|jgi:PHD/YefM family antitoxin component YafN of YafNO toxin-antitoxin module|nr:hypothetical protein [Burkholderiales bacterium]
MSNMQRVRRGLLVTLLIAVTSAPVHAAEPLTLFLLKMLRDQIASSVIESAVNAAAAPRAPAVAPALAGVHGVDEEQLRGLIDTGFVHLSSSQRQEVYASLVRMLADPKNALARPLIIEQLAQRASAVRSAHEQLALLSNSQKRAIVADARAEYERLRPEERDQLVQLLRSGVAPIPRDLNDQMLAAFTAPGLHGAQ